MSRSRRSPRFSKKVKKRDQFTCRLCGSQNELQAHHLFGKKQFPRLEKEMKNLITLCHPCHQRFHQFCPNGKNTGRDFLAFLDQKQYPKALSLKGELVEIVNELELKLMEKSKGDPDLTNETKEKMKQMVQFDIDALEPQFELKLMVSRADEVVHSHVERVSFRQLEEIKTRWTGSLR